MDATVSLEQADMLLEPSRWRGGLSGSGSGCGSGRDCAVQGFSGLVRTPSLLQSHPLLVKPCPFRSLAVICEESAPAMEKILLQIWRSYLF